MPVCPTCRVAYFESEVHQCRTERTGFAASLPQDTAAGLVKFGVVAGVGWSVVPFALIENLRPAGQIWTVPVAGALTGIMTSFTLAWCLRRLGRIGALGAGIVALLLTICGYIRLEEWSKGYYTKWLRLVAIGMGDEGSDALYAARGVKQPRASDGLRRNGLVVEKERFIGNGPVARAADPRRCR